MVEQTKSMREMMETEQAKIHIQLQNGGLTSMDRQDLEIRENVIKSELQIISEKELGLISQQRSM